MSSNVVNFDTTNEINNQRTNNQKNDPFNLHIKSQIHDDKCYLDVQTSQSRGPGNYHLENNYQN